MKNRQNESLLKSRAAPALDSASSENSIIATSYWHTKRLALLVTTMVCVLLFLSVSEVGKSAMMQVTSSVKSFFTQQTLPPGTISDVDSMSAKNEKEVLYWVAPMDSNYQRDQPGLSPMGMALVPVYATGAQTDNVGEFQISAAVVNNLGVRTHLTEVETLEPKITSYGVIAHNEDSRIHVAMRAEGWIEQLRVFDQGEQVSKGEVLFHFYSPELLHAQENYLSALVAKNPRLIQGALGRMRALAIPESRIRRLDQLQPSAGLSDDFRTLPFYAPSDGHVAALGVREGSFIDPSTVVLEIVSTESVWLIAEVYERDLKHLQVGQQALMELTYFPGERWQGAVEYIYPTLSMQTRSQRIRVRFDNPDHRLKPNMYASVSVQTRDFQALTVPAHAVIRTESENRVVVALGQGRFHSVALELGWQVGDQVVVLSGLQEGDRVVTSGQFLLDSESNLRASLQRMEVVND